MKRKGGWQFLAWISPGIIIMFTALACNFPFNTASSESDQEETAIPTKIQITPVAWEAAVIVDVAPVRSGPGVDYDQISALYRGRTLTVLGKSAGNDWYLITSSETGGIGKVVGWITLDFIASFTPSPFPTGSETPPISSSIPTATSVLPNTDTPVFLPMPSEALVVEAAPTMQPTPTWTLRPPESTPTWTLLPPDSIPTSTSTNTSAPPEEPIIPPEEPSDTPPAMTAIPPEPPSDTPSPSTAVPQPPPGTPLVSTPIILPTFFVPLPTFQFP